MSEKVDKGKDKIIQDQREDTARFANTSMDRLLGGCSHLQVFGRQGRANRVREGEKNEM